MSNRRGKISLFLCIIVNFVLNIFSCAFNYSIYIVQVITQQNFHANMTEKTKKRSRHTPGQANQTIMKLGIDENWKKLLSSNLMEIQNDKTELNKNRYTGEFRRTRKENSIIANNVNGLKKLNISNVSINNNSVKQIDVSERENENEHELSGSQSQNNDRENRSNNITKFLAIDCEMVGVGYEGGDNMLARVSLVNKFGDCIYDKFVKPREEVIDYRTKISGVRKEDLLNGENFKIVQKEVAEILRGRIIVGHSLKHDLSALLLSHPKAKIRDTSKYKPFRSITKGSTPSLKRLAKELLGVDIQHGEHSSVEDAKAVMRIYCTVSKNWEQSLKQKYGHKNKFTQS